MSSDLPDIVEYAIIDDNGVVTNVISIDANLHPDEESVLTFLNTGRVSNLISAVKRNGVHNGFRHNPATIGGTYDAVADAFIEPRPIERSPSFILDTSNYKWVAPVAKPNYLPSNRPFISLDDPEEETEFNNGWSWEWNETKVAWEFTNAHRFSVLNDVQRQIVLTFIASIDDVK